MSNSRKDGGTGQLELSLNPAGKSLTPHSQSGSEEALTHHALRAPRPRPAFRVIQGEGLKKAEPLGSRDAVVRVLLEAGADLLLRRISPERAQEIEESVDRVLGLFDQVDRAPHMMIKLRRELEELETLVRETRNVKGRSTRR